MPRIHLSPGQPAVRPCLESLWVLFDSKKLSPNGLGSLPWPQHARPKRVRFDLVLSVTSILRSKAFGTLGVSKWL